MGFVVISANQFVCKSRPQGRLFYVIGMCMFRRGEPLLIFVQLEKARRSIANIPPGFAYELDKTRYQVVEFCFGCYSEMLILNA